MGTLACINSGAFIYENFVRHLYAKCKVRFYLRIICVKFLLQQLIGEKLCDNSLKENHLWRRKIEIILRNFNFVLKEKLKIERNFILSILTKKMMV